MKLLKVDAVEGAVPCWILLTCLQVLATCQSHVHTTGSTNQVRATRFNYFGLDPEAMAQDVEFDSSVSSVTLIS